MKFLDYQKQDLARLALHDGGILAWDKGLGKTLAMFSWSLLKVDLLPGTTRTTPAAPVLLVGPGDVHEQIAEDGRSLLKVETTLLESLPQFLALSSVDPATGRRVLPPGFYLASYTGVAVNGIVPFPDRTKHCLEAMISLLHLSTEFEEFYQARHSIIAKEYNRLNLSPDECLEEVELSRLQQRRLDPSNAGRNAIDDAAEILRHLQPSRARLGRDTKPALRHLDEAQTKWLQWQVVARVSAEYSTNIGETRNLNGHRVKCVYSPSLADYAADTFKAVAIDEGVRMKGDETLIGLGLRRLAPEYRLVLSGTPIKNRLPDVFHLAHWATGHHDQPTSRWPFSSAADEKQTFAASFLLAERNLTREKKSETNRRYVKLSPKVCNIHLLWKLFGPIILRRLKADIGKDIVAKHRHVIRVPMGTAQARTYRYHMEAKYMDTNGMKAIGAQLTALRIAAAAPHCANLVPKPLPAHCRELTGEFISGQTYIPKYAAALTLIDQCLARGEQIVLFSCIIEPLEALSRRLRDAGVEHIVAHGHHSPERRRKLSAQFKRGRDGGAGVPVMLASGECMAEAHSWHLCNNVAHLAFSWAADKLSQCIDRCHRVNSVKDLNYYAILCDGTVDRVLEGNLNEKNNTSDLVLDAKLSEDQQKEVSLAEILQDAASDFNVDGKTIDERDLEAEWPALRESLRQTCRQWKSGIPITTMNTTTTTTDPVTITINTPPQPKEPAPQPPSPPNILTLPTPLHPWKERQLRRRNLVQLSLA